MTYGGGAPTFDAQGYDTAFQEYQRLLADYQKKSSGPQQQPYYVPGKGMVNPPKQDFGPAPLAPDRNAFYRSSGDPDVPTITQTLSPQQQAIFDKRQQTQGLLGDVANQGAESLKGIVGTPVDYSGAPARPGDSEATRKAVIDAMMSRVNEDVDVSRDNTNSSLIARGIAPGTKAYENEMRRIDRGYNDARQAAIVAGGQEAQRDFNMDTESRKNYIAELLSKRQVPINEISALMSGSQVNNPFAMPGFGGGSQVAPAPVFGAFQQNANYGTDLYNADVAKSNQLQQTGAGLLSSYLGYLALTSDARLKSNIQRIGTHPIGVGIYEYDIEGRHEIGVMAQEVFHVKPEAVIEREDGYLMVDYGALE